MARQRFVYLIRVKTVHKIGVSINPDGRLASLVRKDADAACVHRFPSANATAVERALHLRFLDKRIGGEWFTLTPEDVAAVCAVTGADTPDDLPAALRPTHTRFPKERLDIDAAKEIGLSETIPPVCCRLTPEVDAILVALARRERRTVSQMLRILVEEALIARGVLTPEED